MGAQSIVDGARGLACGERGTRRNRSGDIAHCRPRRL